VGPWLSQKKTQNEVASGEGKSLIPDVGEENVKEEKEVKKRENESHQGENPSTKR